MGRTIGEIHAAMKRDEPLSVADAILYAQHHSREAARDEREACALIAEAVKDKAWSGGEHEACERIAQMIRARSAP